MAVTDDHPSPRVTERLARAARAAQALSETLWEALHEELADPRSRRVLELSERLAEVPTALVALARGDSRGPVSSEIAGKRAPIAPDGPPVVAEARVTYEPSPAPAAAPAAAHGSAPAPAEPTPAPEPRERAGASEGPLSTAVLIDELASAPAERPDKPTSQARSAVDTPTTAAESSATPPLARAAAEIEIRDERSHEPSPAPLPPEHREERGPAAWIDAIGRRLERYERDARPFAVLLVELVDVERLRHAALPGEVSRLTGLVEAALAQELRPADTLTREGPGRYWLLAPETDSDDAGALAERLASAVRHAAVHRGAPLEVAVGVAVCPLHGRAAAALAAHADIGLYAARASGRPVA
jgi:GGDEF domain-containing protein